AGELAEYDVVVVGAGPGGSAAAYFLARAGARVAILEKKRFPRPKTCGDGLTPRALKVMKEMGLGPEMESWHRAKGLRVIAGGRNLELSFPQNSRFDDYGLVLPRKDLDARIAARAEAAGAELFMKTEAVLPVYEGSRVAGVRWVRKEPAEEGGVRKVDEGEIRSRFIVVADGASSSFGRALGVRRRSETPVGLAIRTYYETPRHRDGFFEAWLEVRKDGDMLPGYGWLFPVGDGTVNVGVGVLSTQARSRHMNLNHLQRAFVDMLPPSYGIGHQDQRGPFKSGRLPLGWNAPKPFGNGYVAIGDAAGVVNPFTGEGIAYAMETGKLAAGLVADALATGSTTELAVYREALHDTYAAYFRLGMNFVRILERPRVFEVGTVLGMRSKRWMQFVIQIMSNSGELAGGRLGDRTLQRLIRLAEYDLADLRDPEIPVPRWRRSRAALERRRAADLRTRVHSKAPSPEKAGIS
ncbi:MAG: NAD(P)/FAD-dependent oxidoreductase, partial [Actinomycetota bacterium]